MTTELKTAEYYADQLKDNFAVDIHLVVRDGAGNKIIEGGSTLLQDNTLYYIIEDIANYLNNTKLDEGEGTGI